MKCKNRYCDFEALYNSQYCQEHLLDYVSKYNIPFFILLFLSIFLISSVSGQSFEVYDRFAPVTIWQDCSCSYVNITSILYQGKNATNLIFPISMTKAGIHFNYTIAQGFNKVGEYIVSFDGDPDGIRTPASAIFEIQSPRTGLFHLDFKDKLTISILIAILIGSLIFIFFRMFFIAGVIMVILGLLLLFNQFNFIISILIILGGVLFSVSK